MGPNVGPRVNCNLCLLGHEAYVMAPPRARLTSALGCTLLTADVGQQARMVANRAGRVFETAGLYLYMYAVTYVLSAILTQTTCVDARAPRTQHPHLPSIMQGFSFHYFLTLGC